MLTPQNNEINRNKSIKQLSWKYNNEIALVNRSVNYHGAASEEDIFLC